MKDQLFPNQPSTARPLAIPPPTQSRRQLSHRLSSLEKVAQDSDVYLLEGRTAIVAARNSVSVTGGGNGGLNMKLPKVPMWVVPA
mmetsp:Transcript_37050/g.68006  ORF Transcript_37050/g.68006 Transcript_37050/m.68006 type:complete len:85 (+) Transcript_37050:553-807(+)